MKNEPQNGKNKPDRNKHGVCWYKKSDETLKFGYFHRFGGLVVKRSQTKFNRVLKVSIGHFIIRKMT